jgi:glycosyltransferase involved in cell wall biosynthesis
MDLVYTPVVATMNRPEPLRQALESLEAQTLAPAAAVVVDASTDGLTRDLAEKLQVGFPVHYVSANVASAAQQRNVGAEKVTTPLIAFVDDDVVLPPNLFSRLVEPFARPDGDQIGGVAGRIRDLGHPLPRGLLWWYYRIQAGYADETFGARLFGPAINTLPCYDLQKGLIRSEWLNSTCVLYRNDLFQRERFPNFEGYSFMEDVHLSARIGKTHRLYFDAEAVYDHFSVPTGFKNDRAAYAAAALKNRRIVAREVMGLPSGKLEMKLFLDRIFQTVALLKSRGQGWRDAIRGTWSF